MRLQDGADRQSTIPVAALDVTLIHDRIRRKALSASARLPGMNIAARSTRMTQEEFFRWIEAQEGRYEFDGFQPVAMVGGSNRHNQIAVNIIATLHGRLRGSGCRPFGSDAGVGTIDDKVRYPDVSVTCSKYRGDAYLVPNPVVVFEVTSPSSARDDQIEKLREYYAVPSIQRYVIAEQSKIKLTVHTRQDGEQWATTILGKSDVLMLPELATELSVADIYDGVSFADVEQPTS